MATTFTVICLVMVVLVPMAVGDLFFRKPGREIGYAVCNAIGATCWLGIWVFGLVTLSPDADNTKTVGISVFLVVSLLFCGVTYALLIREIKKRKRIKTRAPS